MFRKLGLSLSIDGSSDHELNINGFQDIEIADWNHDLKEVDQLTDGNNEHDNRDMVEFIVYGA